MSKLIANVKLSKRYKRTSNSCNANDSEIFTADTSRCTFGKLKLTVYFSCSTDKTLSDYHLAKMQVFFASAVS
jgi:hypothetical protein